MTPFASKKKSADFYAEKVYLLPVQRKPQRAVKTRCFGHELQRQI